MNKELLWGYILAMFPFLNPEETPRALTGTEKGALRAFIEELCHDPMTEMLRREWYFRFLSPALNRVKQSSGRCLVWFGDVTALNYQNSISYEQGDKLIKAIGVLITRHIHGVSMRMGGDEFAGFSTKLSGSELDEASQRINDDLLQIDPTYRIDIGYCTHADIERLRAISVQPSRPRSSSSTDAQMAFDLASTDAQFRKYYSRVGFLVALRTQNQKIYEQIFPFARKGAGMITRRTIERLVDMNPEGLRGYAIKAATRDRLKAAGSDPYRRAVLEVVLNPIN